MRKCIFVLVSLLFIVSTVNASIPENKEVTVMLTNITKRIPRYDQNTGFYLLYDGNKQGIADSEGNIIVPIEWDNFTTMWLADYGFITGERNGKNIMFDVKNQHDIPFLMFDKLETCIGDCYKYDKNNLYFVVSRNGKDGIWRLRDTDLLVPCNYDQIVLEQIRSVEFWPVKNCNGLGLYGNDREIIPCGKYSLILAYNKDFTIVSDGVNATYPSQSNRTGLLGNGKFGFINLNSGEYSGLIYDGLGFYGEGCIGYNMGGELKNGQILGGKWGYIDFQNNKLTNAIYDEISPVKNGAAHVTNNGVHDFFISPLKNNTALAISKVDENIPILNQKNDNSFAIIIANENYFNVPHSKYSINDGEVLKKYCVSSFGIPERNIVYFTDATYGNIMTILKRIEDISDVYDGEASFLIYYSGLGMANPETGKRALLPIDASPSLASTIIDIDVFFERLLNCKAKEYICILDAPFNGEDRSGNLLNSERGISIKSTFDIPQCITVVMPGDEGRSNSYDTLKHGLLTYSLLNIVQDNRYNSILKAIDDIPREVKRSSLENYNNIQTVKTFLSNE